MTRLKGVGFLWRTLCVMTLELGEKPKCSQKWGK